MTSDRRRKNEPGKTSGPPRIDTSSYFSTKWGKVREASKDGPGYDLRGDFPESSDELLLHVHGWRVSEEYGIDRINAMRDVYRSEGYDEPIVGLTWDSTYSWWNSKKIADRNAVRLAEFITDYRDRNPGTCIRLQGHSMGARLIAQTLVELGKEENPVESVTFLGGAVRSSEVATEGKYGEGLEHQAGRVDNYWYPKDMVLNLLYINPLYSAVGNRGCKGSTPENYFDHEIDVNGHGGYYEPGNEAVHDFVESIL